MYVLKYSRDGLCTPLGFLEVKNVHYYTSIFTVFECKSQYLNVQKTENKNVHYPLLFRLTFQKSSLFLQAI